MTAQPTATPADVLDAFPRVDSSGSPTGAVTIAFRRPDRDEPDFVTLERKGVLLLCARLLTARDDYRLPPAPVGPDEPWL